MKKILVFIASITAICSLTCGCSRVTDKEPFDEYKTVSMHASWSVYYNGIEELCKAESLDLIARVKIDDGKQENNKGLMMTTFAANVEELIYGSDEDIVNIVMTGGVNHDTKTIYEISDDPLMQKDDEFIIFARKNESGTYTVLGGPQGRFIIEIDTVYPLLDRISQPDVAIANVANENNGKSIDDFIEEIKSYL